MKEPMAKLQLCYRFLDYSVRVRSCCCKKVSKKREGFEVPLNAD